MLNVTKMCDKTSLVLKHSVLTKMSIESRPKKKGNDKLRISYEILTSVDNDKCYLLKLRVKSISKKGKTDLIIDTKIEGLFIFTANGTDQSWSIIVNSCSILYSLLRGQLLLTTSQFENGKFLLPTVSMKSVVREYEEAKSKKIKAKEGT